MSGASPSVDDVNARMAYVLGAQRTRRFHRLRWRARLGWMRLAVALGIDRRLEDDEL